MKACIIFDAAFSKYSENNPPSSSQTAPQPHPSDDFLSSLASGVSFPIGGDEEEESESNRWKKGRGGGGDPNFPLKWWKVSLIDL